MKKEELLDKRQGDIDREVENIKGKAEEVRTIKGEVEERKRAVETELERVAGLSEEEAKQKLVEKIETRFEEDFRVRLQKLEREGVERLDRRAKDILSTSIQRLAASTAGDIMTTSVTIPNEEIRSVEGESGPRRQTVDS